MPLQVENEVIINATAARVWHVLTESEFTRQYMFGCAVVSDWKEGDALTWVMTHEGKEVIPVKGFIKKIVPNVELCYTVIDPNAAYEDSPQNHLNVTYTLMQHDNETRLTVVQDGFEDAADGEKRYKDVYNNGEGWQPILEQIKMIAEA